MTIKEEAIEVLVNKAKDIIPGVDESILGPDTSFEDDLHCKSVNYVQFSAALEDEFDVEVPFMEFRRKKTFAEAGEYIGEMLGE